jgi:hypothetical protein
MLLLFSFLKNPRMLLSVAALLAICYGFYIVMDRAALIAKVDKFNATEAQNNERNDTNQTINNSSDAAKCKLIGGVFSNGTCV